MWHVSFFSSIHLELYVCVPFNIYKDIYDHTRLECSPILSGVALLSCDSLTIDAMRRLATTTKERKLTNSLHLYLLASRCQSHSLLSHCNPGHGVNSANPEFLKRCANCTVGCESNSVSKWHLFDRLTCRRPSLLFCMILKA